MVAYLHRYNTTIKKGNDNNYHDGNNCCCLFLYNTTIEESNGTLPLSFYQTKKRRQ
jgi:hypothetical protein